MDVRVFPNCQHLKHENAKGPNITPEQKEFSLAHSWKVEFVSTLSYCFTSCIICVCPITTRLYNCLHAGELLLEKSLRGSPFDRQLFPLWPSPFRRLHCETKVCNLRPEKLVQQDVPEKSGDLHKRNLGRSNTLPPDPCAQFSGFRGAPSPEPPQCSRKEACSRSSSLPSSSADLSSASASSSSSPPRP